MKRKLAVLVAIIGVGIGVLITQPAESRDIDNIKRGEEVCVRWDDGSYWCGVVIDKDVKDGVIKVRVTDVKVKGFLKNAFGACECTGNERLEAYSSGKEIWVNPYCISD